MAHSVGLPEGRLQCLFVMTLPNLGASWVHACRGATAVTYNMYKGLWAATCRFCHFVSGFRHRDRAHLTLQRIVCFLYHTRPCSGALPYYPLQPHVSDFCLSFGILMMNAGTVMFCLSTLWLSFFNTHWSLMSSEVVLQQLWSRPHPIGWNKVVWEEFLNVPFIDCTTMIDWHECSYVVGGTKPGEHAHACLRFQTASTLRREHLCRLASLCGTSMYGGRPEQILPTWTMFSTIPEKGPVIRPRCMQSITGNSTGLKAMFSHQERQNHTSPFDLVGSNSPTLGEVVNILSCLHVFVQMQTLNWKNGRFEVQNIASGFFKTSSNKKPCLIIHLSMCSPQATDDMCFEWNVPTVKEN